MFILKVLFMYTFYIDIHKLNLVILRFIYIDMLILNFNVCFHDYFPLGFFRA